tara:strand:+ start:490 stop:1002 length:513 start_codon:yes stop_codon:yes gene_type:complete
MDFTAVFTRWIGDQGDDTFRELATLLITDEIAKQTEAGSTKFAMPQQLLDLFLDITPTYRWSSISRADFEEMMALTPVNGKLLSVVWAEITAYAEQNAATSPEMLALNGMLAKQRHLSTYHLDETKARVGPLRDLVSQVCGVDLTDEVLANAWPKQIKVTITQPISEEPT